MSAAAVWLGFDVGGTHVRAAAAAPGATDVAWRETGLRRSYDGLIAAMRELADEVAASRGIAGVGVGLPGVVRENRAVWVPNVPFVVERPLATDLADLFGAPVYLANDAQVALLGEARYGAAQQLRSAALFSIGTGIGGAILVGDRILRGAHGAAGSFGWVNVDATGVRDPDHGQLELLASGRAIEACARREGRYAGGRSMVTAARQGDAEALSRMREFGGWLGVACATVASTLDPEAILISGGVSDAFDLLGPAVSEAMGSLASPSGRTVPVRVASLGSRAGAWGAAALAEEGEEAFLA